MSTILGRVSALIKETRPQSVCEYFWLRFRSARMAAGFLVQSLLPRTKLGLKVIHVWIRFGWEAAR